jgi:hypothetical protein
MVTQADRQKVCDLRSQQAEHEKQIEQLRKTWQQETHRLVSTVSSTCQSLRYADYRTTELGYLFMSVARNEVVCVWSWVKQEQLDVSTC